MDRIATNLGLVRQRIAAACQRSGRDPSSVTLVGVTKGVPPALIRQALALGLTNIGENRVQEARTKRQTIETWLRAQGSGFGAVAPSPQPPAQNVFRVRWHMIGHLQRNKAKQAVELFDVVHSVDSVGLAEELGRQMTKRRQETGDRGQEMTDVSHVSCPMSHLDVFIQVNISGEATKFGCRPEEAAVLARAVMGHSHLRLRGLMTLAPFSDDAEQARPHFRRLRLLRDELASTLNLDPSTLNLSMGMSGDFEVAIEEGADLVRIGTAIFETGDRRQETSDERRVT